MERGLVGAAMAGIAFGGALLIVGLLFRLDLLRGRLATQYHDMSLPRMQRHGVFALPFGGATVVCASLAIFARGSLAVTLGLLAALLALLTALVFAMAPGFSRPRWLDAEAAGSDTSRRGKELPARVLSMVVLVLGAGLAIFFIVPTARPAELVGALLMGAGVGLGYLPRRRRRSAP